MPPRWICPALVLALAATACAGSGENAQPEGNGSETGTPGIMDVVARGKTFEAPSQVQSGWTTLRFSNESPYTHFAVVERLPEGQHIASQQAEVAPAFEAGMELLAKGDVDAALKRFGDLPAWFGQVVYMGGPGLTAAGHISQATINLTPGTYLLECYVKTDGVFHSYNPDSTKYGMVHEFTVVDSGSGAAEPDAAVQLNISSTDGIRIDGKPVSGPQTFSVHFDDQTVHENFVGHDVHVVKVSDDLDMNALQAWMDWRSPTGLQTPAPADFVGGLNEMPAGSTGYFTVTLDPGHYALISEVPDPDKSGMLKEFTIE